MWLCPHILILDEPTNYLDRDGLGALTLAINDFEGGVIIISHNREFCSAVATEKWIMKAGRLEQEGESVEKTASGEKEVTKEKEVKLDASDCCRRMGAAEASSHGVDGGLAQREGHEEEGAGAR